MMACPSVVESVPSDFRAVEIQIPRDCLGYLPDEDQARIEAIYDVYFYDKNAHTYCCEMTPSYFMEYLSTNIVIKPGVPEMEVGALQDEYCNGNGEDCYMHCSDVDRIAGQVAFGEGEVTPEEVREYWQGNSPF